MILLRHKKREHKAYRSQRTPNIPHHRPCIKKPKKEPDPVLEYEKFWEEWLMSLEMEEEDEKEMENPE